jgi:hypothetical protein
MPSDTEYSLCIRRWTKRGAVTQKFYHPVQRELEVRMPVESLEGDNMREPLTLPIVRLPAIAAALALLATAAGAQSVYKYTEPDGRVIYTDNPDRGNGRARPIEIPASPGAIVPAPGLSAPDKKLLEQADRRAAALDRAVADIVVAHTELRAAETRREQGIGPIEGERQGHRFRPEYWDRQQALKNDIDLARAKLDDAIERRNALR